MNLSIPTCDLNLKEGYNIHLPINPASTQFLANGTSTSWISVKSLLEKRTATVSVEQPVLTEDELQQEDLESTVVSFLESWPSKGSKGQKQPQYPLDVSIRYAICAGSSTLGLTLEIQALPAHAATLNSHPVLSQPLTPAVLVSSIPLSCHFFREGGLFGPRPSIFVLGEGRTEEFADNITNNPEIFCSGTKYRSNLRIHLFLLKCGFF